MIEREHVVVGRASTTLVNPFTAWPQSGGTSVSLDRRDLWIMQSEVQVAEWSG